MNWFLKLVNVTSEPQAQAKQFNSSIAPQKGIIYTWAVTGAQDTYKQAIEVFNKLDEKANELIKYLAGGSGLVTIAALATVNENNRHVIAWCILPVSFSLLAIFIALLARIPQEYRCMPTPRDYYNYIHHYKYDEFAKCAMIGAWELKFSSLMVIITKKGWLIRTSYFVAFISLVMLIVPMIAAASHPTPAKVEQTKTIQPT